MLVVLDLIWLLLWRAAFFNVAGGGGEGAGSVKRFVLVRRSEPPSGKLSDPVCSYFCSITSDVLFRLFAFDQQPLNYSGIWGDAETFCPLTLRRREQRRVHRGTTSAQICFLFRPSINQINPVLRPTRAGSPVQFKYYHLADPRANVQRSVPSWTVIALLAFTAN